MLRLLFSLISVSCFAQSIQQASIGGGAVGVPHTPQMFSIVTNTGSAVASLTASAVTVSGSNPAMIVVLSWSSGVVNRTSTSVTSGTGAQSLSRLCSTNFVNTKQWVEIWGVLNPTTGDVVGTLSGSATTGIHMYTMVWTNVGSFGLGQQVEPSGSVTTISLLSTALASDIIIDDMAGLAWTPGALQNLIGNNGTGFTDSVSTQSGIGPLTMSWSGGAFTAPCQVSLVVHSGGY